MDEKDYKTIYNEYIIAYLLANGYKLSHTIRSEQNKIGFCFVRSDELSTLIDSFYADSVISNYSTHLREVRQRIGMFYDDLRAERKRGEQTGIL